MVFTFCNIFANLPIRAPPNERPTGTTWVAQHDQYIRMPLQTIHHTFGASVGSLCHRHDQNDDGFMHATCIDELQHESLIWTHEPMDDKQRTSGMSSNDVGRDRGWLGSIDWPLIGYYYSRIDYDVIDEI